MVAAEKPSELALHGNVAENWRRFKQRLMLYLEATEKATKPDKLKVAILLNFIGEEALEVFNTFHLKEDEAENFDLVINKFDDFCEPKKNVIFERFKFFSATQKDGETIDSFITELKGLSTSCEFESQKDSLIRDRIVYGIQDKALQERLLREPNLTLLKAIEMCKTDEISKQQIKIMQNNQNICQIRKYEKKHSPKQNQESEKEFKCQRCGKSHRAKNCPAWGKRCSKCKKMNHFAAFCKSSAIRSLNDETEETVRSIHEAKVVHTLEWKKSIIVNGKEICFKLDSGAEVNVLPYTFTRQMKGLEIFQTNRKLTSYTGHEIKIKGIATLNCKTKNKTESLEFFIADGYYQPILGIEAIEKLSLIKKCDAVQTEQNNSAKEILNRHKNIFEGIGRLPIEHKIRLKENATPVIAPSRKIPFSIREKVKAELERMEKLDIIEKFEEPSEWTHPIVVVQKPSGDVRICMDPRELNKYVQRERYILPTAETIFSELKGATVFSVFDASSAFWQVPLDKESTNLCTIATPFGRFRFKRLPYGLNSASEVFQRCINNILSGLQGTACYMDDILIYGSTMEEHNRNLETVLRRLEENNVKLNAKKQQIAVDKVNFLGHIISRDGIAIQASRAEAIQKLKRPENKTEVQRFLGMVTYLGKFIPNLSDKTAPLRKLISNKSEWKFGGEEIDCFKKLKDMVSNAPILTFFDPTKPITISSDASQYGIGTVLMQGGHAIEYASFSLNATQRKYAQIEKELLAIVFGCERFQYYIWGNDVIVETDHKPLLSIVKKPLEKLSPRLQRMVLRLMRFQISLKFTPGKNMFVADHLSRDPLKDEVDTSYLEGQTESVHMLLVTTDEKIKRLQKETHGDHTLIQLIEYAKNGWPKYKTMVCDEAKPYWQFQDEIHVSDGIVYKGNCIVVPSTLRKEILQVVHSSHQGIAASKEKARSAFYWPGMITQVENEVEKCRTCQEYSRKNPEESRIAHEIPEFPWEKIAVDFMEVSGTSSILVVDYHSKFVEIRKLSSKRETETIMQLKTIFRTHGIPRTLVSDNGPPFNSTGFKNFAQKYEFKHQTSSPKYPRSNGQVERTIQTIKGLIIKAVKSGRDPNLALMEFNNTPKYDLPSPTQMLMGRSVRTLSTYTRQQLKPLFDTTKNYQKLRDHQQKYAGSPKRILRPLEVGDNIMLQERHRKWVPATVTAKHETPRSYMVKTPSGSEYRRNRSHLRPRKFSVEDSAPTSQSPSIPGSQAGTAMDDNIQDHGRPTSENRRAYDPRENVAKKGEESSTSPSVRTRSGRTGSLQILLDFKVDDQLYSDHHPLVLTIKGQNFNEKKTKREDYNITRYRWSADGLATFKMKLEELREKNIPASDDLVYTFNQRILEAMSSAKITYSIKGGPRKSKPWFDKDCYDMKKLAKESLKKYRKTNRLEDRECYASSRKKYLALLDLKRKGFDNEKQEILRNAKDSKTFWKTIALYKSTSIIQGEISIQDWLNFYRELMTTEKNLRICNLHNVISQNDPILDSEITNADIYKEIAGLRSNKACGPDGIPNEVLKTLPDSYILLLKQLYNSVMTTGKYPAIWTNSTIHPIFKNGYKNSPSNYRDLPSVNLPEFGDIHLLLYADDIAIIGESRINLQKKIKILKEYLDENLMTLNESKSKIMVFRNGVHVVQAMIIMVVGRSRRLLLLFSGPEPLKDHLNSKNHKKKAQLGISSLPHNRQNWSCQVCQVGCSGPEPFKQHLDSRGHQRELRKKEILEENGILTPPPTTTLSPDSSSPHICHLCQVSFPQFNLLCQHMESLSHKMTMRKHNPMAQAEEDGLQTLTGDDQVDKNVEEELPLVIHPAGQASEEEPAISVTEYCLQGTETNIHPSVANIPAELSSAQGYYTCKICNIQVTGLIPYQHHMDGAKHQKKFMQVSQSKSSSQDIYERKLKIAELIKTFESDDDETGSEKIGTSLCCTTCHNEAHEDIQALVEHYNSTPHALSILDKQLSQDIGENWRESEALIHYFRDKFDNQE
ncbi:K02A2.6-like [Cordylochernes scorpioides]|uniref:RNA-directed DNA polymerase n=1 Tax=Cordylochernes scorpioides TaxID=51811 RepID=A0ABY6KBK2_9ARAC|nr:K02A2.6-like [Cordylochernes scorpioides]